MGTEMVGVPPEVAFVLPSARSSRLASCVAHLPRSSGLSLLPVLPPRSLPFSLFLCPIRPSNTLEGLAGDGSAAQLPENS